MRLEIVQLNYGFKREPTINLILRLNLWWGFVTHRDIRGIKMETHVDIVAVWFLLVSICGLKQKKRAARYRSSFASCGVDTLLGTRHLGRWYLMVALRDSCG